MLSKTSVLIVALVIATACADTTPDHVSSKLQVNVPASLFMEGGYDHREALFGSPPYGGSISQFVYYADSDLCDPTVDNRKGYPLRPVDDEGNMEPWESPFILMVDRGGCSFVKKVRNAQHAGAAAVIIADNVCLCTDLKCLNVTKADMCENNEPIMADDGSGGDVTIPSFLIYKHDADALIKELVVNKGILQLEMTWDLPQPDDRVEYDLWTVPTDESGKEFQQQWKTVAKSFGSDAYFTPHFFIYDGLKSHCVGPNGKNMCFNLCTNNGRYCAVDPDSDLEHGISGADVVTESLRRICIWNNYGESDGVGEKYWNYVMEFMHRCDDEDHPEYFFDDACVKDVYKKVKIDGKRIDSCIRDSGGIEGDNENTFLKMEISAQVRRGVVVLPTMFVNAVPLRGALNPTTVFDALCAGFLVGTQPAICDTCSSCENALTCVQKGKCVTGSSSSSRNTGGGVSKRTFGFTLLFLCGLFGTIGYLHWKRTREEMRDQVRGILAEYMPLDGGEDEHNPMDFARGGGSTSLIS